MPPLNLDLLDPRRDGSLELYAAQIQELVLWIRDEGHVLSSIDQHFIEQWWEAGYPLDSILEALRESGLRLKGRKNPPRGLPLRSMKKWVVKAGERARVVSVGHHEADGSEDHTNASASPEHGAVVLETLSAELVAAQEAASALSRSALKAAQTEVEGIARESLGESELFAALLGIGRRYYDACWESLSQAEQGERRGQISASLGDAADSMDLEAYETTLDELCRRALRGRDPLFDPQRYWSL